MRQPPRRSQDQTSTNYLLVESIHTPKGPRQQVIGCLGDLSPRPAAEGLGRARQVEAALVGQAHLFSQADPAVAPIVRPVRRRPARAADQDSRPASPPPADGDRIAVPADRVARTHLRAAGPVQVGFQSWKRRELAALLHRQGFAPRAIPLTWARTWNRLIHPDRDHARPRWIRSTALADLLGADLTAWADGPRDRNLDRLPPQRAALESQVVQRERRSFPLDPTVSLSDRTGTDFHGPAARTPQAQRGYSRDHRPDGQPVVIGRVIGREGCPLAQEILAGPTQDRKTRGRILDLVKDRVGRAEGSTVGVARGLASAEDLPEIRDRRLPDVVAARPPERDRWRDEVEDGDGFEVRARAPSPRDRSPKESWVRVQALTEGEEAVGRGTSAGRTAQDRAIRQPQQGRLLADLPRRRRRLAGGRLQRELKSGAAIGRLQPRYPRGAREHTIGDEAAGGKLSWAPAAAKEAPAEPRDGGDLLRTDRTELTAPAAGLRDRTLTRAEGASRAIQTPWAERPIFPHLEPRVEAPLFLGGLAYHLRGALATTRRNPGVPTSWSTVRETGSTPAVAPRVLPTDGGPVRRLPKATPPEPEQWARSR